MKVALFVVMALVFIGCTSEEQEVVTEVAPVQVKVEEKTNAQKIKDTITEQASTLVSSVKDSTAYLVESVIPDKIDGKALYASCIGCHGANGEKKALGKSAAIQGWNAQKTMDALNGYSDGSYGGALKSMMKSQADKLTRAEKEAIAEHISKL